MRFNLRYGDGTLQFEPGSILFIDELIPQIVPDRMEPKDATLRMLENPDAGPPFSQSVRKAETIVIIVDGPDSETPTKIMLKSIFEVIKSAAIKLENVSLIISCNKRRTDQISELNTILGDPLDEGCPIFIHDPSKSQELDPIGDTPTYSTPLQVNHEFARHDYSIAIASIVPSVLVGASGGRMSVLPGISGDKTIARNMKLQATKQFGPLFIDSPASVDMIEAAKLAGLDFIINTVHDWHGNIARIVAGDPDTSWRYGVETLRGLCSLELNRKADVAIVGAGGSPRDLTLYSAIDALHPALEATRRNAMLILVAECSEGPGPKSFVDTVSAAQSSKDVALAAETGFEIGMEKARLLWHVLETRQVILCSRLRPSLVSEHLHCINVRDPQEGLEIVRNQLGTSIKLTIIPDGFSVVPT